MGIEAVASDGKVDGARRQRKTLEQQIATKEEELRKLKAKAAAANRKARNRRLVTGAAIIERTAGRDLDEASARWLGGLLRDREETERLIEAGRTGEVWRDDFGVAFHGGEVSFPVGDGKGQTGARIRLLRTRRGLTQRELAEAAGAGESALRSYELGRSNPKRAQLEAIAQALGVRPEALEDHGISTELQLLHQLFRKEDVFKIGPSDDGHVGLAGQWPRAALGGARRLGREEAAAGCRRGHPRVTGRVRRRRGSAYARGASGEG